MLLKTRGLKGIRQLRQDPVEALFTFICSSNNNISRISSMVERMCQKFGEPIAEVTSVDSLIVIASAAICNYSVCDSNDY